MFTKILCPIDLAETSKIALKYAFTLSIDLKSDLLLVHASPKVLDDAEESLLRISLNKFHEIEREEMIHARDEIMILLHDPELKELSDRVPSHLYIIGQKDHAGRAIVNFAMNQDIDLIVIHRHEKHSPFHFLSSDVSDYIIHHSKCPVLVAP
jgi:nucleotide-binding universal stress UspA family protein